MHHKLQTQAQNRHALQWHGYCQTPFPVVVNQNLFEFFSAQLIPSARSFISFPYFSISFELQIDAFLLVMVQPFNAIPWTSPCLGVPSLIYTGADMKENKEKWNNIELHPQQWPFLYCFPHIKEVLDWCSEPLFATLLGILYVALLRFLFHCISWAEITTRVAKRRKRRRTWKTLDWQWYPLLALASTIVAIVKEKTPQYPLVYGPIPWLVQ